MNNATLYNKSKNLQKNDAKDVLDSYFHLMKWKCGDNSLDIGCGDGEITTSELLKRFPSDRGVLIGVDKSFEMLKFASENYHVKNVGYQHMDIGTPVEEFDYNAYSHIFSFNCIHWIPDQMCVMKNIYNLLKNGGDFIIAAVAKHNIFEWYKVVSKNPRWKDYMDGYEKAISPYNNCDDPENMLKTILHSVGFKNVVVQHVYKKHQFNGIKCLRSTAAAVNPFMKRIPTELHQDYLDEYIKFIEKCGIIDDENADVGEYTYSSMMAYGLKE